jgi:hypothetical protein
MRNLILGDVEKEEDGSGLKEETSVGSRPPDDH